MIIYLLKMIACSAAFYALYHFVFRNIKMLQFNRFYLLLSLVASFLIPLITFTVYVPMPVKPVVAYDLENVVIANPETAYTTADYLVFSAAALAVLVSLVLAVRFGRNIWQIRQKIRLHEAVQMGETELILLDRAMVPYSFMNRIFIGKADYEQGRVEEAVLLHELAHVRQKHSWDILFIEFLQIFTWFNPVLYLYKKAIRTNHEFLADDAAIQQTQDVLGYQQVLLQSIYVNNNIPLASSFYFFTTKKRILMLHNTFKRKIAVWAGLAVLPLLALLVVIFSSKTYAQVKEPKIEQVTVQDIQQTGAVPDNVLSTEIRYDKNNKPLSAAIEYKDGKVVNEDISTAEKQKAFEKKYNLRVIAGEAPSLQFRPDTVPQLPPPPKVELIKYLPPNVKTINVKTKNGSKIAEIIYKDGRKVSGDISTNDKEKAFEKKYGVILPPPPPPPPPPSSQQKGASQKEIEEYNAILKEMRVEREDGRKSYKFIDGKTQRAVKIYNKMTEEQHSTVEMLPPPPPPPPPPPSSKARTETKEVVVIGRPMSNQDLKPKNQRHHRLKR